MNTPLTRRRLLVQALIGAGLVAAPGLPELLAAPDLLVANVTQLYSVRVARIATPRSAGAIRNAPSRAPCHATQTRPALSVAATGLTSEPACCRLPVAWCCRMAGQSTA